MFEFIFMHYYMQNNVLCPLVDAKTCKVRSYSQTAYNFQGDRGYASENQPVVNIIYSGAEKGPLVANKWCWYKGQSRDLNLGRV